MEQKNFFTAMALIAGFMILWTVFVVPRITPPHPVTPTTTTTGTDSAPGEVVPEMSSAHAKMGQPLVVKDQILRDEQNEIVLTSKGGAVRNWRLDSHGHEIDLVLHPEAADLPLATFADKSFSITIKGKTALMQATLDSGVRVTKVLSLGTSGDIHTLSFKFENPTSKQVDISKWTLGWGPGLGTDAGELKENTRLIRAISLGKLNVRKMKDGETQPLGRWAAIDNRYYLAAFIPMQERPVQVTVRGAKDQAEMLLADSLILAPRASQEIAYELYVGPKGHTHLKGFKRDLEQSVDFGFFASLGKGILNALYFLKSKTGNYGLAIILLTMGIQLLMLPLTLKSFKATQAMKKLQPKIAELQARYKADPKRLNVEMMNLYKNSKTNPLGGCLPMLLQLPIFLALFTALRNAFELRGAPFFGWITDLSAPDVLFRIGSFPLHALPLIMGCSMFFQQRMSGATSDPMQRQMMTMMPIMFTVMFYGFPSGLVLYWLTNNLMTMASQFTFQRLHQTSTDVVDTTVVKG